MEEISTNVQDDGIRNTSSEGEPITGGRLILGYLLNRCQEDFERGWVAKEATTAAAATKALEDEAPGVQVGHWSYLTTISNFIPYRICSSSVNVSGSKEKECINGRLACLDSEVAHVVVVTAGIFFLLRLKYIFSLTVVTVA